MALSQGDPNRHVQEVRVDLSGHNEHELHRNCGIGNAIMTVQLYQDRLERKV